MIKMFSSATRLTMLIMVLTLCAITVYGAIRFEDQRFTVVFALFSQVITGVITYFYSKSTQETKTPEVAPVDPLVDALKQ